VRQYVGERAELSVSLDVIYHLVEDDVYHDYLCRLFDAADRFVLIYSTDCELDGQHVVRHAKHRQFTKWVQHHRPAWQLFERIPNRFPAERGGSGSSADFFLYRPAANPPQASSG
jgi:hypothetical protein